MKAVLELPEMPRNCWECDLCMPYKRSNVCAGIFGDMVECPDDGKRKDCPLIPVDYYLYKHGILDPRD